VAFRPPPPEQVSELVDEACASMQAAGFEHPAIAAALGVRVDEGADAARSIIIAELSRRVASS
jgi:hypothetical protein